MKTPSFPKWLPFLLIVICLALAYANSLPNQFVYDDGEFISRNSYIKNFRNWPLFFTNPLTQSEFVAFSHYRPLTTLSYAFNYALGGLKPFHYHLTNLILHLLNTLLVYWLIRRVFDNDLLALLTALFWGLHPLQTESVGWIASRANLLSAFFYLVAALIYLHWREAKRDHWWLVLLGLTYLLGLLSKELVLVLPFCLLFLNYLKKRPLNWPVAAGLLLLGGLFWTIRAHVIGHIAMPLTWADNPLTIISTMSRVLGTYGRLMLIPTGLHVDYQYPLSHNLLRGEVILSLASLAGLIFLTFYYRERQPVISLALGWFFINILPVANIIPFQVILAERFLYLPSLGFCLLLAYILVQISERSKIAAGILAVLISASYLGLTARQNLVWQNEFTLWGQVVRCEPNNSKGHYGLGTFYLNKGQYDLAIQELIQAVSLDKTNYLAFNNLGAAYKFQQKYTLAIPCFIEAIKLKHELSDAYFNLADCYATTGDFPKAIQVLEALQEIIPVNAEMYYKLTLAYIETGDKTKARQYCQKFTGLQPNSLSSQVLRQLCQ